MTEREMFEVSFFDETSNDIVFSIKKARKLHKKGHTLRAIGSLKEFPELVRRTSTIQKFVGKRKFETRNSLYTIC